MNSQNSWFTIVTVPFCHIPYRTILVFLHIRKESFPVAVEGKGVETGFFPSPRY